jgi:uncharacterized protein DUF3108
MGNQFASGATGGAPGAPYFIPGEVMTWEISVAGIVGGEATLAVGQPGMVDGRQLLVVRSRTISAGALRMIKEVKDEVTTSIDLATARPTEMQADMLFGSKSTHVHSLFTDNIVDIEHGSGDGPMRTSRVILAPGDAAFDSHSAMGLVRAWNPQVGERRVLLVFGGRRLWRSTIELRGREAATTPFGTQPALRYEGVAVRLDSDLDVDDSKPPRQFTVWLSDDADKVPLRVKAYTELGDVEMVLTDYRSPVSR